MAILNARSRVGAANLGTPLMILSFAVMAGFLYWLSLAAEPTAVVIDEPTEAQPGDVISVPAFSQDPAQFMDTEVAMQDVDVASILGPHSFWMTLADVNNTPYLVHMSSALASSGTIVTSNSVVDLRGTVTAMSDSILDAWEAAGAFPGANDRIQAEFAESFIEATELEVAAAAPSS